MSLHAARCGFGAVVVNPAFEPEYDFGTDLEGRFLYIADGERRWLLAAFDFLYMWRSTCLQWREAVSRATGIPPSHIWVHTTQVHTAPRADLLDGPACDKLVELSLPVIERLAGEAEPAELSYVVVDLEDRFNFNRETFVPELGAVTSWGGQLQTDRPGPPYTQDPDVLLLNGYKPDIPAFHQPVLFDRPVDSLATLLMFRSCGGDLMGGLLSFAGHPDIAGSGAGLGKRPDQTRYNFDWPGYVRQRLSREFRVPAVCVNGPCGNVGIRYTAPATYEEADAIAHRIGDGIASACIDAWRERAGSWQGLRLGDLSAQTVDLPLKDAMPRSRADMPSEKDLQEKVQQMEKTFADAIRRGETPARIKRLGDEILFTVCIRNMVRKWTNISDDELRNRVMTVELQALRLNDLVLAGFPAESMSDTAMRVRAQTLGARLVPFDQMNGYHAYLPNDTAHSEGGYSYWGSLLARGAEPIMRRAAIERIRRVAEGN